MGLVSWRTYGPHKVGLVQVVSRRHRVVGRMRQLLGGKSWSVVLLRDLSEPAPHGRAEL